MWNFLLYMFALIGVLTAVFTLIQLMRRTVTDAAILYPMYREQGDIYFSLRTLSRINLPLIVIAADTEDTTSLEQEFLYADFVKQSAFSDYIQARYERKEN